jgi:hypothetical protein
MGDGGVADWARRARDRCGRRCGLPPVLGFVRQPKGGCLVQREQARVARESMIQSVRGFGRRARSDRPGGMPCAARPLGFVRRAPVRVRFGAMSQPTPRRGS